MSAELIINADYFEIRVALVENGQVAEFFMERSSDRGIGGNIYKGRVVRVLPGMQAAFVDVNLEKAAFLYVSDVHQPMGELERLFLDTGNGEGEEEPEPEKDNDAPEPVPGEEFPVSTDYVPVPIEDRLQEGQEVLVQVAKEPIGGKGPRITTHITLPGRNLVLMPTMDHVGVSRRIENEKERKRLRDIMCEIRPPRCGFIVRTAAEGVEPQKLQAEMDFLLKLWQSIQ
ncbi:MAG: Rne/Rng family ribonuclease, partial [Syntrophobacteraceae bacterium]|nr:Rne/Rng family ribonuclease [Syntrophobacteraceae bacterium]